jgi:signal transduction histidine kinase
MNGYETGAVAAESCSDLRYVEHQIEDALAIVAHELRGPLAAMQTSLELMRRLTSNERCEKPYAVMERQISLMGRIVSDLLDMHRIEHGDFALQREDVDIAEVISQALDSSETLIEQCGHELRVRIQGTEIRVCADQARLTQVVANLLDNAIKYTPRGGRILVEASLQNDDAVISVSDTGIGIEPGMLEQIFGMYARICGRSTGASGLGIGLALVKRLVELQSGTVEARSGGPDAGATFIVRLPHARGPSCSTGS